MLKTREIVFSNNKHTLGHYAFKNAAARQHFSNQMKSAHSIVLTENDRVVDIGAYVGEYALWACRFAERVIAYEPTPDTFDVLRMNTRHNLHFVKAAVVGNNDTFVNLHLSKGIGVTNSIAKTRNKAGTIRVDAVRYEDAVRDATVVKIDVEGAEYSYNIIQPQLRAVILEFHPMIEFDYVKRANEMMDELRDNGFRPTVPIPQFTTGWDTNSAWLRELK